MNRSGSTLLILLCVASVLRLYSLSWGGAFTDEVSLAFRAVGMLDTLLNPVQTTPLEWFDPDPPPWTRWSFHDHPPLVIAAQHLSIELFGDTRFAFRLPSALLGIASVLLIYGIGRLLYSNTAGLLAAALLALTVNPVYISRVGLQEAYVIFFVLLFLFSLLRSLTNSHYLFAAGAALGFGLLTKYISGIVVPVAAVYLALQRPSLLRSAKLWLALLLAALIFSPVILYNIALYRSSGHFDFQLSYLLGQEVEAWRVRTGRTMMGGFKGHLGYLLPSIRDSFSWPFLALFAAAAAAFFRALYTAPMAALRRHGLIALLFAVTLAYVVVGGPSYRFVALLAPAMVLANAALLRALAFPTGQLRNGVTAPLLALFFIAEGAYTINSVIAAEARGPAGFCYAAGPRSETIRWGYNDISDYLARELRGKRPAVVNPRQYVFLEALRDDALEHKKQRGDEPYSAAVVYDGEIPAQASMWSLMRWSIYHGWVVIDARHHFSSMRTLRTDDIAATGFDTYYFILPSEHLPLQGRGISKAGRRLERELGRRSAEFEAFYNSAGKEIFRAYKLKGS